MVNLEYTCSCICKLYILVLYNVLISYILFGFLLHRYLSATFTGTQLELSFLNRRICICY